MTITRERAIEICQVEAKRRPQSYYAEPFQPHEWVIAALLEATREVAESEPGRIREMTAQLAKQRVELDSLGKRYHETLSKLEQRDADAKAHSAMVAKGCDRITELEAELRAVVEDGQETADSLASFGDFTKLEGACHEAKPGETLSDRAVRTMEKLREHNVARGRDADEASRMRDRLFTEIMEMRQATGIAPENGDWATVTPAKVKALLDGMREFADKQSDLIDGIDKTCTELRRQLVKQSRDLEAATRENEEAHSALDGTDSPRRGPEPTCYALSITQRMVAATKETAGHIDNQKAVILDLTEKLEAERKRVDELAVELTKGVDAEHVARVFATVDQDKCAHTRIIPVLGDQDHGVCTSCGDASFVINESIDPGEPVRVVEKPTTTKTTFMELLASEVARRILSGES